MTSLRSLPQYIPSGDGELFTLHYPADGLSHNEIIVICPPAPQETMRSQAGLGQLAKRLQGLGYHVIRFDHRGTGDSSGSSSSVSIKQWLEDLVHVHAWLRREFSNPSISFLGLRLGATLALLASQKLALQRLILWDPVLDGTTYQREMETSHSRLFDLNQVEPPFRSEHYSSEQCWGFPWTASWRQDLQQIEAKNLKPKAQHVEVVMSTHDSQTVNWASQWHEFGPTLRIHEIGEALYWGDERYIKIRAFPTMHLRRLEAILGESNYD